MIRKTRGTFAHLRVNDQNAPKCSKVGPTLVEGLPFIPAEELYGQRANWVKPHFLEQRGYFCIYSFGLIAVSPVHRDKHPRIHKRMLGLKPLLCRFWWSSR